MRTKSDSYGSSSGRCHYSGSRSPSFCGYSGKYQTGTRTCSYCISEEIPRNHTYSERTPADGTENTR